MIKIKLSGVEIRADFTFFAVIAMFAAFDSSGFAMMSLAVCLIHEAGHLAAMLLRGEKPSSVTLRGGGIRISGGENSSALVLAAGSAVNLALFAALYFALPKTDLNPVMFAVLNLVIGLFNLLPLGCLDGSGLLSLMLAKTEPRRAAAIKRAAGVLSLSAVIFAAATAAVRGEVNFTIIAAFAYVMAVDVLNR